MKADDVYEMLGEQVRAYRKAKGWTLAQLAYLVTQTSGREWKPTVQILSKLETGQRPVTVAEALVLAEVLGVDLGQLLTPPRKTFLGWYRKQKAGQK